MDLADSQVDNLRHTAGSIFLGMFFCCQCVGYIESELYRGH